MDTIDKIFKLMEEKNISANALSKELGFKNNVVFTQWKNRQSKPSADALAKLADYFDVSVDYLLGRTDTPKPEVSPEGLVMPAALEGVPLAFYGGLEGLTQESLDDLAKYIEFLKERQKK